jgi:hypothetical protein
MGPPSSETAGHRYLPKASQDSGSLISYTGGPAGAPAGFTFGVF